jgi:TonB-linked SusC/RagA family outer membrane protein
MKKYTPLCFSHTFKRYMLTLLVLGGWLFAHTAAAATSIPSDEGTVKMMVWQLTGKVTSASGEALPGVTVLLKGTTNGTTTGVDGTYTLSVPETAGTLIFSFIGYTTQEKAFSGPGPINATLADDAKALQEVVVTGYAVQEKKDLTGSVAVVNVEEMTKQPTAQVTNMLQGRAAGVTVVGNGQPGEAPQVRIRGFNTFGNNTPLYVVDGIPTTSINDLNPNDIANMQVLKDAGSASIYGSRAANGVIIISTKKGKERITVNYDGYYGTQRPPSGNVWDLANPQEMADLTRLAQLNSGVATPSHPQYGTGADWELPDYLVAGNQFGLQEGDPATDPALYSLNPLYTNSGDVNNFYRIVRANKAGTNWFQEIASPAPITSHNLAVSGGGEQGSYFFSFNYFDQEGVLINTYLTRYTLRSNSQFNVTKNIRVGENLGYSVTDNPRIPATGGDDPMGYAFRQQPLIPVYDIAGNFAGSFANGMGNSRNPVAALVRRKDNDFIYNRLFGNMFVEVDLWQDFTLRTSFGGEIYANRANSFTYPEYENAENVTVNAFTDSASSGYNWTWTNTLAYHKKVGDIHDFRLLVGTEAYNNVGNRVGGATQSYFSFDPNFTNLGTGSGGQTNFSFKNSDALYSLLARLDYTFRDKYLLGATIRRDGSSRFKNTQYGTFPAVSAGWRISEEGFMQGNTWLTDLKLRAGYGIMGNQLNVNPMNAFTTYGADRTATYYDIAGTNQNIVLGFRRNRIGNPDAKWESNANGNVGIDATLLGGMFDLTVDYYSKQIRDLLYNPELPGTSGTAQVPFVNIAKIRNRGVDGALTGHFTLVRDLKLDITGTLTTYNNEILRVSNGAQNFDLQPRRFNGSNIIRNQVGQSISSFFGYQIAGFWNDVTEIDAANAQARTASGDPNAVFQTDVKPGRFRYADVDGDGLITPGDRTTLGSPNPDFSYGLNLNAGYRNFDFTIFLYGTQGNEIWNQVKWWTDFYSNFAGVKSKTALYDSWTPERRNATAPIQETVGSFSTTTVPNSYYVENGSYLRAKNAQIGYTLPLDLLSRYGIGRLRVYVQAANLFTITDYSGIDPELNAATTTAFGIDEGSYPNMRQYLVGVNVSF